MSARLIATFLLGGIAAVDATPVAQTLLSQPLFTATILGALWGNLTLALEVGIVLQIMAASTLPVGARTPEDYAVGGVVGAGVALALGSQQPFEVSRNAGAMLGALAGMIGAVLGVPLIKWQRRRNDRLFRLRQHRCRSQREPLHWRDHVRRDAGRIRVTHLRCGNRCAKPHVHFVQ